MRSHEDPDGPGLLSIPQVAELSGLSEKSVRRAIKRGELRAMKLCNRMRIAREDMEAWHDSSVVLRSAPQQVWPEPFRRGTPRVAGGMRELLDEQRKSA